MRAASKASPDGPSKTGATAIPRGDAPYKKLETARGSLFLDAPEKWAHLNAQYSAFNGSYSITNRMVKQYVAMPLSVK